MKRPSHPPRSFPPALLGGLVFALALLPSPAALRAGGIDPLVLRIQDVEALSGAGTLIVVRTYASRPVRRGKISVGATPGNPLARLAGGASPIASWDGGYVFDASGARVATLAPQPDGSIEADFDSPTFTINAEDGLVAVIEATLAAGLPAGAEYELGAVGIASFLRDPEDDPIVFQYEPGRLRIRSPALPVEIGAGEAEAHPGSGAIVHLDTKEPFAIGSGTLVLEFDPTLLLAGEAIRVTADPRHGQVALTVDTSIAGRIEIVVDSADGSFNTIPGELVVITLPLRPGLPPGAPDSAVTWDQAASALFDPDDDPIVLGFEDGAFNFGLYPNIFHDNFEIGDTGWWPEVVTPPAPPVRRIQN